MIDKPFAWEKDRPTPSEPEPASETVSAVYDDSNKIVTLISPGGGSRSRTYSQEEQTRRAPQIEIVKLRRELATIRQELTGNLDQTQTRLNLAKTAILQLRDAFTSHASTMIDAHIRLADRVNALDKKGRSTPPKPNPQLKLW